MKQQLLRLVVWGIAFGYMEAAVVVYLRALYYPEGFLFPVEIVSGTVMATEVGREAATLLIMAATVCLGFVRLQSRIAAFAVLFGVWDLCYYLFLKLILDWPEHFGTWDILFLIPLPWAGPVWAPMLVSAALVAAGSTVLVRNGRGVFPPFGRGFAAAELAAGGLIVTSFLLPGDCVTEGHVPDGFPGLLFLAGFLAGSGAFLRCLYRGKSSLEH
jgi:hypothetical protein